VTKICAGAAAANITRPAHLYNTEASTSSRAAERRGQNSMLSGGGRDRWRLAWLLAARDADTR
jgi:hypothetical protein